MAPHRGGRVDRIDEYMLSFSEWISHQSPEMISNLSYGVNEWNEDQPRASDGRWTSGGGESSTPSTPQRTEFSKSSGFSGEKTPTIGERVSAIAGKIHSTKAALYEKLPGAVKSLIKGYHAVEHTLEKPYKAAQNLALAVARERGLSDHHVDRVARVLSMSDTIKRWTGNIPIAHHILEHAAGIGGPLGFLGAKVGFYVPIASLAYLSSHLARETISGKNPLALLKRAHERIQRVKAARGDMVHHTMNMNPNHDELGRFSVGDFLTHVSPHGHTEVEFRGYHNHPETGQRLARVIFRSGNYAEGSVDPSQLAHIGQEHTVRGVGSAKIVKPEDNPYTGVDSFHPKAVEAREASSRHEANGRYQLSKARTAQERKEAEKWIQSSTHLRMAARAHELGRHSEGEQHSRNADRVFDGKKPLKIK